MPAMTLLRPRVFPLLLIACGGRSDPELPDTRPSLEDFCGSDFAAVEARIDALLDTLSLEEKASLMHGESFSPAPEGYIASRLEDHGIPGFRMVDGPRGLSRVTGLQATAFPVGMARAATWDPDLERRVGQVMGVETRAAGADVLLAPTMNILYHPRWGRAQETYGEDPLLMGDLATAFVEGAQEHVLASAKHFAVNSIEDTRFDVDVTVDERTLREVYLPHFKRVVQEAGVASVMTSYNSVNGAYCSENAHLLTDILRDEWGFHGFVESDWVFGTHDTVAAARAGLDIEMPNPSIYGQPLVEAVETGQVELALVDAAVRRILRAQFCFELDTNPAVRDPSLLATPAHTELAREVARRSLVLLKNEGALPIDRNASPSIVVLGDLADIPNIGDRGSSSVDPAYVVTPLDGIEALAGPTATVTHLASAELSAAEQSQVAAADLAIVVTGLTEEDEGEGLIAAGDRTQLALSAPRVDLIREAAATGTPTVVVLEGGSAIAMEDWLGDVSAVLMAWYPGMEGGHAIAEVLYGEEAPSGRLPIVFPRAEADLPPFDNVSLDVTYAPLHGYRHLQATGTSPLFPFGFGLTYTRFAIDNLVPSSTRLGRRDTLEFTVDITNTGASAGTETLQVYIGTPGSDGLRPPRELKGFRQVRLEPGATETVQLAIPIARLATYDVARSGWVVEAAEYVVEVGHSSADLPLSFRLDVSR
jgi:beta-glucosidase